MKKIPVFTGILLIAGVLATMAFSHPLVVRNGVVRGYSANNSITIVNHGQELTYMLPQGATVLPQNAANSIGAGARVTVIAQCFHSGTTSAASGTNNEREGNQHVCVALGLFVRAAAQGAVPATGGTGGTAAGTSTPAAGTTTPSAGGTGGAAVGTSTPAASATTTTGTTGSATATPMVCPTATGTGTPAAGGTTGTTGTTGIATATMTVPCVTPTSNP